MTRHNYKFSPWRYWEIENEKLLPKLIADNTIERYMIKESLPFEDAFVQPDIIIRYETIHINNKPREFYGIIDSKYYMNKQWLQDDATNIFAQMGKYKIALQNYMNPKSVSIETVISMPDSTCQKELRAIARQRQISTLVTKDLPSTINHWKQRALEIEKQYQID